MLGAVRNEFGLEWEGEPVDIGGSSNLNLYLPTEGTGHMLRVHRAWVTPARLGSLQSVRQLLARRGLPFIEPIPTRTGTGWIRIGGHLAEVERYVGGEDMDGSRTLRLGMPVLARVHSELRRISAGPAESTAPVANHVDAQRVRIAAARAAAIISSWNGSADDDAVAASTEQLASELWEAEAPLVTGMPVQLVHGDFWDNNVKFHGDAVAGILDLDFMEERPRIDDLALILYYAYATLRSARLEDSARQALADLVGNYGLQAGRTDG